MSNKLFENKIQQLTNNWQSRVTQLWSRLNNLNQFQWLTIKIDREKKRGQLINEQLIKRKREIKLIINNYNLLIVSLLPEKTNNQIIDDIY